MRKLRAFIQRIVASGAVWLIFFLLLAGCGKKIPDNVAAVVNGEYITVKDFFDSYTNLILYGNQFDSFENRLSHLNRLIDAYLLAQHGFKAGVIDTQIVGRYERRALRKAVRDYFLEQQVVPNTPEPTESDLRKLFLFKNQRIRVKHLFARTRSGIDSLYNLLQRGRNFDSLAAEIFTDTLLKRSGGDLGWNQLGDLDPFLEDVAFTLRPGQISEPVESRFGWHILKLENKVYQAIISEDDFEQNKEELRKTFIRREQDKIFYRFINSFMEDKKAVIKNPEWSIIAREIHRRFPQKESKNFFLMQLPFSPEFGSLTDSLKAIKDNPVIEFSDGEVWTVEQFLARIPELPRRMLYGSFRKATGELIKDHFLTKEGFKKGYNHVWSVQQTARFNRNLTAGRLYRTRLLTENQIPPDSIPDKMVKNFYDSLKTSLFIEKSYFDYALLVVPDSSIMMECEDLLQKGYAFERVIREKGVNLGVLKSGRYQKEGQELASLFKQRLKTLSDGSISEWFIVNRRPVKIKRYSVKVEYYPYSQVATQIRESLSKRLTRAVLDDSLRRFRQQAKIKIFSERIKKLEEN